MKRMRWPARFLVIVLAAGVLLLGCSKGGGGAGDVHDGWGGPAPAPITSAHEDAPPADSGPRTPENPAHTASGLDYAYYQGSWGRLPDFDRLTPEKTGSIANFGISPRARDDGFAFKFTGYLSVPRTGVYTFYTTSDDGSALLIGSTLVVDNDGLHAAQERSGSISLQAGKHAIAVAMFERDGEQSLDVSYAGPGIAKQRIPDSALTRPGSAPAGGTFGAGSTLAQGYINSQGGDVTVYRTGSSLDGVSVHVPPGVLGSATSFSIAEAADPADPDSITLKVKSERTLPEALTIHVPLTPDVLRRLGGVPPEDVAAYAYVPGSGVFEHMPSERADGGAASAKASFKAAAWRAASGILEKLEAHNILQSADLLMKVSSASLQPFYFRRVVGTTASGSDRLYGERLVLSDASTRATPRNARVLVIVHGIRTNPIEAFSGTYDLPAWGLAQVERGTYHSVWVAQYPFGKGVRNAAEQIAAAIRGPGGFDNSVMIDFVGHSLGGLVVRWVVEEILAKRPAGSVAPKVGAVVTLSSPHAGVGGVSSFFCEALNPRYHLHCEDVDPGSEIIQALARDVASDSAAVKYLTIGSGEDPIVPLPSTALELKDGDARVEFQGEAYLLVSPTLPSVPNVLGPTTHSKIHQRMSNPSGIPGYGQRHTAFVLTRGNPAVLAGTGTDGETVATLIEKFLDLPSTTPAVRAMLWADLAWTEPVDLDLYVIDPRGNAVYTCFLVDNACVGIGGGRLSLDMLEGGVETYLRTTTDAPLPGEYRVRVHYFSDHGTGRSVRFSLTMQGMKVNALAKTGELSHWGGRANSAPDATGPDWVDFRVTVAP